MSPDRRPDLAATDRPAAMPCAHCGRSRAEYLTRAECDYRHRDCAFCTATRIPRDPT